MGDYYSSLKSEVGIEDSAGIDDDDNDLDGILATLKPNTTPSNFRNFLENTSAENRTKAWRDIYRKLNKKPVKTTDKPVLKPGELQVAKMTADSLVDVFVNHFSTNA